MGKFRGIIVVDRERCKGCNLCVVACPLHILALTEKQVNKNGTWSIKSGSDSIL